MGDQILSSLPLEVLIYLNKIFIFVYFVIEIIVFIYKGNRFLYAPGVYGVELFFVFVYVFVEYARLFQASRGNKIERILPLVFSSLLAVGSLILYIYYFSLQTYVLKVDRVMNGFGLGFVALETIMIALVMFTFLRDSKV